MRICVYKIDIKNGKFRSNDVLNTPEPSDGIEWLQLFLLFWALLWWTSEFYEHLTSICSTRSTSWNRKNTCSATRSFAGKHVRDSKIRMQIGFCNFSIKMKDMSYALVSHNQYTQQSCVASQIDGTKEKCCVAASPCKTKILYIYKSSMLLLCVSFL